MIRWCPDLSTLKKSPPPPKPNSETPTGGANPPPPGTSPVQNAPPMIGPLFGGCLGVPPSNIPPSPLNFCPLGWPTYYYVTYQWFFFFSPTLQTFDRSPVPPLPFPGGPWGWAGWQISRQVGATPGPRKFPPLGWCFAPNPILHCIKNPVSQAKRPMGRWEDQSELCCLFFPGGSPPGPPGAPPPAISVGIIPQTEKKIPDPRGGPAGPFRPAPPSPPRGPKPSHPGPYSPCFFLRRAALEIRERGPLHRRATPWAVYKKTTTADRAAPTPIPHGHHAFVPSRRAKRPTHRIGFVPPPPQAPPFSKAQGVVLFQGFIPSRFRPPGANLPEFTKGIPALLPACPACQQIWRPPPPTPAPPAGGLCPSPIRKSPLFPALGPGPAPYFRPARCPGPTSRFLVTTNKVFGPPGRKSRWDHWASTGGGLSPPPPVLPPPTWAKPPVFPPRAPFWTLLDFLETRGWRHTRGARRNPETQRKRPAANAPAAPPPGDNRGLTSRGPGLPEGERLARENRAGLGG